MLKNKRILLILIIALAMFLIPCVCNAAEPINATETTQTSTGKTVKWSYELDGDNIINLKCINISEITGEVNIPSTIDGYTVVGLGAKQGQYNNGIFSECNGLTAVTIPNTVIDIGRKAFDNCIGLRKVIIPNSVKTIGDYAFSRTMINEVIIPDSVISIGNYTFERCESLKTLNIQSNVLTSIGDFAFYRCVSLLSVTIPNSVTTIGDSAFSNCTGLSNVTLSNALTKLNQLVFSSCSSLTSIRIPDSVGIIDGHAEYDNIYGAFQYCSNLEKILIPDSVLNISKSAFYQCPKLTIFGNDGQVSKKYAEENQIRFNYIANWDKVQIGDDVAAPKLETLKIINNSNLKFDEVTDYYLVDRDSNISIKAKFDEKIYGQTVPTLTIKCGNGENIALNNGTIQGEYIVYTYKIQSNDKGIITVVSMTGGDIKDEVGNKIEEYTCPELVEDFMGKSVYANGTKITDQDNENNDGGSNVVTLSSITITTAPTKLVYTEGESFDKTGMVVTATYSDESTKQVTTYNVSLTEELKTSDNKVIVTYTENGVTKTAEQVIKVNSKTASVSLSSIKITKAPNKTSYTEGESFNKTGMIVTATYSDETTKTITNYTVSPSGALKTSNKKITVTYTENGVTKTVEQTISVAKDSTTKGDNKLPQTGATLLSLVVVALIVVAVVSKVKYGKYSDIK